MAALTYDPAMLSRFRDQFPEFAKVPDAMLTANMRACCLQIDDGTWAALAEQGLFYLVGHRLALSPFGTQGRTAASPGSDQRTTYWTHYQHLLRQVVVGFRVA